MFDWTVPAENTILTKIGDFIEIFCLTNIADTANNTILTEFFNCKYPGQERAKNIFYICVIFYQLAYHVCKFLPKIMPQKQGSPTGRRQVGGELEIFGQNILRLEFLKFWKILGSFFSLFAYTIVGTLFWIFY